MANKYKKIGKIAKGNDLASKEKRTEKLQRTRWSARFAEKLKHHSRTLLQSRGFT